MSIQTALLHIHVQDLLLLLLAVMPYEYAWQRGSLMPDDVAAEHKLAPWLAAIHKRRGATNNNDDGLDSDAYVAWADGWRAHFVDIAERGALQSLLCT